MWVKWRLLCPKSYVPPVVGLLEEVVMKMSVSEFELLMTAELASFRGEWVREHAEMDLTPCEWYCLFARYLRDRTGLRSALP